MFCIVDLASGLDCFWIGTLGPILIGAFSASMATLGSWAIGVIAPSVWLTVLFPKIVSRVGWLSLKPLAGVHCHGL